VAVSREDLVSDFSRLGVPAGGVMMVHSSLRSIGTVEGGAETVVDALLESLGPQGTLVVPTFTFSAPSQPGFIFDPARTPSEMGAISEAARQRAEARRSIHVFHSIAAIGPLAEQIVAAGGASAWSDNSPMGQIANGEGHFLLLGVPYTRLTAIHLVEVRVGVPYRREIEVEMLVQRPSGALEPVLSTSMPPRGGFGGNDFNRLGQLLEEEDLVLVGTIGNAVARLVTGACLFESAIAHYQKDQQIFLRRPGVKEASLSRGHTINEGDRVMCVVDPQGRHNRRPGGE
jgi:aminoglycoside 3-N-acetyltransferase